MLRGYQRKLIMIRTKESSIFESAFFILGRAPKSFKVRHILIALGIGFLAGAALLGGLWLWSALTPS